MKVVEFIEHRVEEKQTLALYFNFEKPLQDIAVDYVMGKSEVIPVDIGEATVHPKDTYNHKVGRKVAREAKKYNDFGVIQTVVRENESIKVVLIIRDVYYHLIEYNIGKVIIYPARVIVEFP